MSYSSKLGEPQEEVVGLSDLWPVTTQIYGWHPELEGVVANSNL